MLSDLPPIEPHPDLVAVQRPTPADMLTAAKVLGWYPDLPYLTAAVPADRS